MTVAGIQNELKTELTAEVVSSFGSARIRVQGSSMLPGLRPGDEVELHAATQQQINIGDVVAFRRDHRLFVHRVVQNCDAGLITRGDTLSQADAPVLKSEFLGVVTSVFRKGERVDQRNSLLRRAAAGIFRRSQISAALFVKFASL